MKIYNALTFLLFFSLSAQAQFIDWETHFEKSKGLETPRYDETVKYCKQLAYNSDFIKYESFGLSPQGRELPLLIVNTDMEFDPVKVKESGKAILMIQAAIHAGEPDGKDAGMLLIRDLIVNKTDADILKNVCVLFIPIFNVDGHENWSKYNRINQNGPTEMGYRVTAQNYNLNRDYMKVDSPEMQDWMKLYHSWLPDFFVDCHTSDGADYQYDITFSMETHGNMGKDITEWQEEEYIPSMKEYMFKKNHPIFNYVQFRNWHDPRSGLRTGVASPMTSTGYVSLLNRPGLLIETHMLKPYKQRVEATYELLKFTIKYLNVRRAELHAILHHSDIKTTEKRYRDSDLAIDWEIDMKDSVMVDFLGIDYTVEKSDITGMNWYKYGNEEKIFKLPYFDRSKPSKKIHLPEAYIIPEEWTEVIRRLDDHHIEYYRLESDVFEGYSSYEFPDVEWSPRPYENHFRLKINEIKEIRENRLYQAGAVIVPVNQIRVKIIAYLLEPESNNSLLGWGYFNSIFEQKEYGETYVMEKKMREMIADDPDLLKEFEQKKAEDPAFANNHWAMTNWFYQKTKYYDSRIGKYPVGKIKRLKKPKLNYNITPF